MSLKINRNELLLVLLFYCFMTIGYYLALAIERGGLYDHYRGVLLNHILKGLITIPFWWLFFRLLSETPLWKKTLLHFFTLPLYAFSWLTSYYTLCDYFEIYHVVGARSVWDFYITALFYVIQFGNFHLFDYYKALKKQQLLSTQLSKLMLQSELSALKAQLNPHFLYNVFNTINAAIPKSAKHARDMVHMLSDLFRYQLKASQEEFVTVQQELVFIEQYLTLEKERFGDRLNFRVEVPPEVLAEKIPPIIFQPLIENAIKHGIAPTIAGGEVSLSIKKHEQQLNVTISDTGVGIRGATRHELLNQGVGLSNTNERLKKMFTRELAFSDNTPCGLIVSFSIPLLNEKHLS